LRGHGVDPIFLLAPTSSDERVARICAAASGFIYYVSIKGVTGAATLDAASVAASLRRVRAVTRLPIGVGFGIRDAATAVRIAEVADAVIVGSALVHRLGELAATPDRLLVEVPTLLRQMREAMDAAANA
jgi:tryptophan synthase alpha chain